MNKKYKPRIGNCYGMASHPIKQGLTWVEGEMWCTDYGQFKRRGLVRHKVTGELVKIKCDVPDTFFSIPAHTSKEHGFITVNNDTLEFQFTPDKEQITIKEWKKEYKKCYK